MVEADQSFNQKRYVVTYEFLLSAWRKLRSDNKVKGQGLGPAF